MSKSLYWELIFNFILTVIIYFVFVIVPTNYIIEIYINVAIYLAPFLYNELTNSTDEETIGFLKAIKIFGYIVLILYCFLCVFSFPYPAGKEFIYNQPINIFITGALLAFFSLITNSFKKAKKIE